MSRVVKIGDLEVGGGNPVRIKGMLKTPTTKREELVKEAMKLWEEGAEAIRVAVKEKKDVEVAKFLKKYVKVPLVADIHFHYKLGLLVAEADFDALRLNPLNIYKKKEVVETIRAAKKSNLSIRIGVNSGGFKREFASEEALAKKMVETVEEYLKIFEKENFFDIIVSLKSSDVLATIKANQIFRKKFDYPLHIGVTATGPFLQGVVKSSLAAGVLLSAGVGDVIRVSLTAPSFWEIKIARFIVQFMKKRRFFSEIISCPLCSRSEVNLIRRVNEFQRVVDKLEKEGCSLPAKIAIMGCVVNGPGEAYQADIGVAFGKGKAAIFKKGKILGYTNEENLIEDLIRYFNN